MRSNSTETLGGGGRTRCGSPTPPTYLDKHCAIYSAPSVKNFFRQARVKHSAKVYASDCMGFVGVIQ